MDWLTWLSKTGLDPSLVYEYGVAFAQNELEHDDIPYFNHEFLQSMGISIAKHRLEILKLARKDKNHHSHRPIFPSRILVAIKQTKRRFSNYLRAWTRRDDSAALALVPRRSCSGRWKRRNNNNSKRLMAINNNRNCKQINRAAAPLLLTNGSPMLFGSSRDEAIGRDFDDDRKTMDDDEYWSSEIRWDTMFQNLKPT
ncbi:hypothetical protein PHJA_002244600 [Phtheirospermum japonicum]|uniref:SAM domain-containing protein n=1 Tax=Phtheirospermum japonicum TaxID=374723 RepID=A0A830CNV9_9LAMI|nr:hypothetical protein PHJA_002244600 [Phtheirospermum japonicum]